jgi:SOS-response transcriptional repressor LexA
MIYEQTNASASLPANLCLGILSMATQNKVLIWERGRATSPTPEMLEMGKSFGAWFRAAMGDMTKADLVRATEKAGNRISQQTFRVYENNCYNNESKSMVRPIETNIKTIAQVTGASERDGRAAMGYETEAQQQVLEDIANLSPEAQQLLAQFLKVAPNMKKLPDNVIPLSEENFVVIPVLVLGKVSAGTSMFSEQNIIEHIPMPRNVVKENVAHDCFGVNVVGDCLEGLHIIEGDLLICVKSEAASNGDIVVAIAEGDTEEYEATTKRYREGDSGEKWLETVPMYPQIPKKVPINKTTRIVGIKISSFRHDG